MAIFPVDEVAPDGARDFSTKMISLFPELNDPGGCKAIGIWAFAAMRCVDYLVSDQAIDHKRIAVIGHSRGGKTALWTGITAPRIARVSDNDAG